MQLDTVYALCSHWASYLSDKDVEELVDIDITRIKVTTALGKLKENKLAEGDGLNSSYMLSLKEVLVEPLSLLYAKSLDDSEVPNDGKTANITAICKKGNKQNPCNYKPVSLTSNIGKIMEKIIKDETDSHLQRNELFGSSQHGFCSKNHV